MKWRSRILTFDTADAYRESVKQELIDGKKWQAAWTMVVNNAAVNGYPSAKDTYVNGEKGDAGPPMRPSTDGAFRYTDCGIQYVGRRVRRAAGGELPR